MPRHHCRDEREVDVAERFGVALDYEIVECGYFVFVVRGVKEVV